MKSVLRREMERGKALAIEKQAALLKPTAGFAERFRTANTSIVFALSGQMARKVKWRAHQDSNLEPHA